MTAFSDFADEFTVQVADAMEMYDQLRRRRMEGMYARLYAEIAVTAAVYPPLSLASLAEPKESSSPGPTGSR